MVMYGLIGVVMYGLIGVVMYGLTSVVMCGWTRVMYELTGGCDVWIDWGDV